MKFSENKLRYIEGEIIDFHYFYVSGVKYPYDGTIQLHIGEK